MDRKLWLLVLCMVGLIVIASGQKSETKSESVVGQSRYQLVSAQQEQDGKVVFMLDTQTGKVWKYQPAATRPYIPEAFLLVGFGIPAEGVPDFNLKDSASEYTGGVRPKN